MLSVIMPSVIMLSVSRLSVIIPSVIVLSVIMLSSIRLSVIMLNVLAPRGSTWDNKRTKIQGSGFAPQSGKTLKKVLWDCSQFVDVRRAKSDTLKTVLLVQICPKYFDKMMIRKKTFLTFSLFWEEIFDDLIKLFSEQFTILFNKLKRFLSLPGLGSKPSIF